MYSLQVSYRERTGEMKKPLTLESDKPEFWMWLKVIYPVFCVCFLTCEMEVILLCFHVYKEEWHWVERAL